MTYKKNVVILRKEGWHVQKGGWKTGVKGNGRGGRGEKKERPTEQQTDEQTNRRRSEEK